MYKELCEKVKKKLLSGDITFDEAQDLSREILKLRESLDKYQIILDKLNYDKS